MARPLRLEHAGAFWNITSRGNEKKNIFRRDSDRRFFLEVLETVIRHYRWRLHAYALMTNHYHLFVETPEPTLARGMRQLNGVYAQWFNRKYARCGHLFQGRYDARLIQGTPYLMAVSRYLVLNPVRAGMVALPEDWPWSSYRATVGLDVAPPWLETEFLLGHFHDDDVRARAAYRRFVEDGVGNSCDVRRLLASPVVGGPAFLDRVQAKIDEQRRSREHPLIERRVARPSLERVAAETGRVFRVSAGDLRNSSTSEARWAIAVIAHEECIVSLRAIGEILGVGPTGAHYLIRIARRQLGVNGHFRRRLQQVRRLVRRSSGLPGADD